SPLSSRRGDVVGTERAAPPPELRYEPSALATLPSPRRGRVTDCSYLVFPTPHTIFGASPECPRLSLHPTIAAWFAAKGWAPRQHQLDVLAAWESDASALLIAPTGAGKTLAGFLPTLNDLTHTPRQGLHTLYISPLKALAVDVARNLDAPIAEMRLPVEVETRTGDTPASRRTRQRRTPPNVLMTTPEQLALLLSH